MRMHLAPRGRRSDRLRPSDLGFVARREGFEPSNRQILRTPPSGRGVIRTAAAQEGRVMVDYDRSTALVVVDVQNDFADPRASLYVGGGERVVPLANREFGRALAAGALVV
jgi:hypothetical protein